MHPADTDTIAAPATPPGSGGVAVVRVSGPKAADVLTAVFRPGERDFTGFSPRTLHWGHAVDAAGEVLDEVLAVHMPAPRSYTGEDVAELHCHGGPAVVRAVLCAVLDAGARQAEAGEFTKRAFLNGRLDLTQAEAVAEAIAAPTCEAARLAQAKLSGALGRAIRELRGALEDLRAQLCVAVDFPEEDVDCLPPEALRAGIADARERIAVLLASFERAKAWRSGPRAVLLGRVNAGKSTLLNALAGRERALVAETPGTTRDWIEECVDLDGLVVRLVDTAGIREAGEDVERRGVELSRSLAAEADLVLYVVDGSETMNDDDVDASWELDPARTLVVVTKTDLPPAWPTPVKPFKNMGFSIAKVSAALGTDMDKLAGALRARLIAAGGEPEPGEAAPNERQARALTAADAELAALAEDLDAGQPFDILGVRLEAACALLAEITGDITPAGVLEAVFESFCIGK